MAANKTSTCGSVVWEQSQAGLFKSSCGRYEAKREWSTPGWTVRRTADRRRLGTSATLRGAGDVAVLFDVK